MAKGGAREHGGDGVDVVGVGMQHEEGGGQVVEGAELV